MKKFLVCSLFLCLAFSDNSFAQNMKLMWPVKLRNPENENLGFKTPVPTWTAGSSSVSKSVKTQPKSLPKEEIKEEVVVLQPVVKVEEKTEAVVVEGPETEESLTDKNISEARELLRAAERLANSIQDEKEALERDDVKIIPDVEMVKSAPVNILLTFSKNQEDLSSADIKKIENALVGKTKNSELYFKIISYYDNPENRNIAFSRLLNARNVLLDKGIQTSQTMIMVLEDDTKTKANSVEIMF